MRRWVAVLFGRGAASRDGRDEQRLLDLEREVASLRLELRERDRLVANLTAQIERQRGDEATAISRALETEVEGLMANAAAPVAQLATQAHLLEDEGKPVMSKDVIAVAKRLVRALEDEGLSLEGGVGERVLFDPNRHEPLRAGSAMGPGRRVVVRFAAVAFRGKVIRRAGVELAPE